LPCWDRVSDNLPNQFDLSIIVDASTQPLLERTLANEQLKRIASQPSLVIDHHTTQVDLPLQTVNLLDDGAVSTGQIVANLADAGGWQVSAVAAQMIAASIMSDSLGLSSSKTSPESIEILAGMVRAGANLAALEEGRRALNKKSPDIFRYKGQLFERVQLHLDGRLAIVHIPWEEIQRYSDAYNPSMLIIDEMRLIDGVAIAAAIKSYPDGKLTVKLRANSDAQFMNELAEHFGGGGHPFTAGFKVYDTSLEALTNELLSVTRQLLERADG
jgi:phosphoesterase RecJ-like protein